LQSITAYVDIVRQLLSRYLLEFPEETDRLQNLTSLLAQADDAVATRHYLPGHLTACGLVVDWKNETALLIYHKFLKRWLQPGGHLEGPEVLVEAALREVNEEVGQFPVRLNAWHAKSQLPIDVDSHAIPESPQKGEQAHSHHDFIYLFDLLAEAKITLQETEVTDYRWVPIAELKVGLYGQRLKRVAEKIEKLNVTLAGSRQ
jgi:8-oxo-dGTP pyrophosphatase MutT (NUDIX family)